MQIVALRQCDAVLPGPGDSVPRRRVLFLGQIYDLPEEVAEALVDAGFVAATGEAEDASQGAGTAVPRGGRAKSRPQ